MLNSIVLSWRRQSRKHSSGGGYSSISRAPSKTTGIRKHWCTFGLGARSILCIYPETHTDAHHYTTTGADALCPRAGSTLPARASLNNARRLHPDEANASKETELAWFEKTARRLIRLRSEPEAVARWRGRKRGARSDSCGEDSQSYDEDLHHCMARLHLITATGKCIQDTPPSTSGDTTDTLVGANPREEEPCGAQDSSSPQWEEGGAEDEKGADAWEALKRRVLYAEEHGSAPVDMGSGHDAERALRELRARLRLGWAEEEMRMRAQEERTRSTKKRRRDAGCWIRENGVLLRCTVTVSVSSRVCVCEKEGSCPHLAL
jgi:hypothetical protein